MTRSRGCRPRLVEILEDRLALSHASAVVAAKTHAKPHHAAVATMPSLAVTGVVRDTSSTGLVTTIESDYYSNGHGGAEAMQTTTYPDKSRKVQTGTAALVNGVVTINTTNLLPNGAIQSEVDRDLVVNSGLTATHHFDNVVTQPGLGTQTTVGTRTESLVGKAIVETTDEQVTNFDGSVDHVQIVQTDPITSKTATKVTTTTHADGSVVVTTDKIKILSGGIF